MITIIYGENTKESRQYLRTLLSKSLDPITLSSDAISLTDLSQVFEGGSLFSETKTVLLEDYLSKTRKSKEKDTILTYLNKQAESHHIVLWEGKDLTKTAFNVFSKPQLLQFALPQTLFQFLDALLPRKSARLISLHHQTLKTTEPELLFFMLVRHIRLLLTLLDSSDDAIDEVKRLAPWQKSKLEKQAKALGTQKLLHLHRRLFDLERKQKTGRLSSELPASIDFLLSAF